VNHHLHFSSSSWLAAERAHRQIFVIRTVALIFSLLRVALALLPLDPPEACHAQPMRAIGQLHRWQVLETDGALFFGLVEGEFLAKAYGAVSAQASVTIKHPLRHNSAAHAMVRAWDRLALVLAVVSLVVGVDKIGLLEAGAVSRTLGHAFMYSEKKTHKKKSRKVNKRVLFSIRDMP
jgi:hypothetical protein